MKLQTKAKQYQAKWPQKDLTLVENPSTRALYFWFDQNKNFDEKVNSIADVNTIVKRQFGIQKLLNVVNRRDPFHQSPLFLF